MDVDSQLLNTQQSNAAAGIKAAHLAGGCACCSVSADLQAALADLANSSNYQQLDYLVSIRPAEAAARHHTWGFHLPPELDAPLSSFSLKRSPTKYYIHTYSQSCPSINSIGPAPHKGEYCHPPSIVTPEKCGTGSRHSNSLCCSNVERISVGQKPIMLQRYVTAAG